MDSTVWPLFSMLWKIEVIALTVEGNAPSVERRCRIIPLTAKFGPL
jgi:hypothetical protein